MIQIISEGDPGPLADLLVEMNMEPALFKIGAAFVLKNDIVMEESLLELVDKIIEKPFNKFFMGLYWIIKGDLWTGIQDIAKILGFEHDYILLMIVALLKNDDNLVWYAISKSADGILKPVNVDAEVKESLKMNLLAMYTVAKGSEINVRKLTSISNLKIDPESLQALT